MTKNLPMVLDKNIRLDLYLLMQNTDISRNFISIAIKDGFVKVNDVVATKSSYKVKEKDIIIFDKQGALDSNIKSDFENVSAEKIDLDVIYEDEDLLVINKASGVATHPSQGNLNNTVLNGVHYYLHNGKGDHIALRKHMIHRLDKDTSGLILFAKTDKMLWWMHRQFAERKITKKYYALGYTSKFNKIGELIQLDGYIERSRRDSRLHLFSAKYGKWTHTDFHILQNYTSALSGSNQKLSLIECMPKTGRTHQIRVHLKHLNMPIWSDPLYSSEKQQDYSSAYCKKYNLRSRLFLHAFFLEFTSYTGKEYKFEIPLSAELNELLNTFYLEK